MAGQCSLPGGSCSNGGNLEATLELRAFNLLRVQPRLRGLHPAPASRVTVRGVWGRGFGLMFGLVRVRVRVGLGLGAWGRTLLEGPPPSRSPRCLWRGPRQPWLLPSRSSRPLRVYTLLAVLLAVLLALLPLLLLGLLLVLRVLVLVTPVLRLLALLRLLRLPPEPLLLQAPGCASPPAFWSCAAVCPVTERCRQAFFDPKGQTGRDRGRAPKGDTERCWGLGHPGHPTTQHHSSPLSAIPYSPATPQHHYFPITSE